MGKRKSDPENVSDLLVGAEIVAVEFNANQDEMILKRGDGAKIRIAARAPQDAGWLQIEISRPGEFKEAILQ